MTGFVEIENVTHAYGGQGGVIAVDKLTLSIAEGEFAASQRLADAAKILASEGVAVQLRYLQTLTEIGVEKNTTIVFPIPLDILQGLSKLMNK